MIICDSIKQKKSEDAICVTRTNISKDKGQQEREQKANNSSHQKTKVSPHKLNLDTKAQDGK